MTFYTLAVIKKCIVNIDFEINIVDVILNFVFKILNALSHMYRYI